MDILSIGAKQWTKKDIKREVADPGGVETDPDPTLDKDPDAVTKPWTIDRQTAEQFCTSSRGFSLGSEFGKKNCPKRNSLKGMHTTSILQALVLVLHPLEGLFSKPQKRKT